MINEKIKKIYNGKIERIEKVAQTSYYIEINCQVPVEVKAGQFVTVYCSGLTLRRPFSVFSNDNGRIGILLKERGNGTKYLTSLKIGDNIDLIGPLGNQFNIEEKKSLLIGAGIGIAPISFLKKELDKKRIENCLAAGFLNKKEIPINIKVDKIYTDDGSNGEKGSVVDYLDELIKLYHPLPVLKTVANVGEKYCIATQISMEKVMACAIGVCRGCVINIKKNGSIVNAAVCKEGPVFNGSEVVWE